MSKKLFIGGLSFSISDEELRRSFEVFGRIDECVVVMDRETERSRGFGFVTFGDEVSASKAQARMNGMALQGREIRVDFAEESAPRRGGRPSDGRGRPAEPPPPFPPGALRLFVGGLSWDVDVDQLRETFEAFGKVRDAKVIMDRETGQSRGFGFVTFEDTADAERAAGEMKKIGSRNVRVNAAEDKPKDGASTISRPRSDDRRSNSGPAAGPTAPPGSSDDKSSSSNDRGEEVPTSRRRAAPPERGFAEGRDNLGPVQAKNWDEDAVRGGQRSPRRTGSGRGSGGAGRWG